jgi:hypothetical protein
LVLKRGPLADHHRRRKLFIFGWRSPCPILNLCSVTIGFAYTVVLANSIGSAIEGSSFSGLLTRVEIGHIRIGSAGTRASVPNGNSHLPDATNARRMVQLFSFLASLAISRHVARSV